MMSPYAKFIHFFGVKRAPNEQELRAFAQTQKIVAHMRYIPGIECVCVCNSMSMYASKPTSDIDLFIITKSGYLWLARTLVLGLLTLTNTRAYGNNTANRFCCSFFLADTKLNLDFMALPNDTYLWHWVYFLKPIINKNETYERFLQANNLAQWPQMLDRIQNKLSSHSDVLPEAIHSPDEWKRFLLISQSKVSYPFSWFWRPINFLCQKISLWILKKRGVAQCKWVILTADIVKLHIPDKREQINQMLEQQKEQP